MHKSSIFLPKKYRGIPLFRVKDCREMCAVLNEDIQGKWNTVDGVFLSTLVYCVVHSIHWLIRSETITLMLPENHKSVSFFPSKVFEFTYSLNSCAKNSCGRVKKRSASRFFCSFPICNKACQLSTDNINTN